MHGWPPVLGMRLIDITRHSSANYRSTAASLATQQHWATPVRTSITAKPLPNHKSRKISHGRNSTDLKVFFRLHLPRSTCNRRHLRPVGVCSTPFLTCTPDNSSFHRRCWKSMFVAVHYWSGSTRRFYSRLSRLLGYQVESTQG